MTNAQIDRAIACLRAAPSIGQCHLFLDGEPYCALGHMLNCVNVGYRPEADNYFEDYPELKVFYGLDRGQLNLIWQTNDDAAMCAEYEDKSEASRSAVIALLNSWRTP